jgi:hypothetical protein
MAGCSQPGPAATVTVPQYQPPIPNAPGAPTVTNINVTGPNAASATVSWNTVAGATYYKIFINGKYIGQVSKPPALVDLGAYVGQTIQVSVAACN